jgi:predicted alpha-1,2-mannosidase
MRSIITFFFCLFLFACQTSEKPLHQMVNPFIGTGGHGHTYPGAVAPFGMVQLSPDTRLEGWDGCGGYHYSDDYIYGFSHTHLSGTGIPDYADFLFSPLSGELTFNNGADGNRGYGSKFVHEKEFANAGFYKVHLDDYGIDVKLTSTQRAGFHHYTFSEGVDAKIVIDLHHRDKLTNYNLEIVDSLTVRGFRYSEEWAKDQRVHFYAKFSQPIINQTFSNDSIVVGLSFGILTSPLKIKVGISAVDVNGAQQNLEAEIPHWNFEKTKNQTQEKWEQQLAKIKVSSSSEDKKVIFYTALYHSMLNPNIYSDVDGQYRGMDGAIHKDSDNHYTIFSLWDTFRASHPLFTIIEQKRTNEFIRTLLRQYQQGGKLPIWELAANYTNCMIGYHAIPVIADAYVKGITAYDVELALQAMVHSATLDGEGLEHYKHKGFIAASDEPESVSKTLEYSYDDWCIAMMADSLGQQEIANTFYKRGQYYKNVFDPTTGFLRAKVNNNWFGPFKAEEVNFNYTEANAWQYSLYTPQDIQGHIELMGGVEAFDQHLDNLFSAESQTSGRQQVDITGLIGQYAHGNEPSHHMAYLYNYIDKPWKTQNRVRQIMEEQYQNAPDGLSGNEDCGQMSAWYVLSSMGIYSVTPGLDYYTIGTPLFDEVELTLESGRKFNIKAQKLSPFNKYIQSITLNGMPYEKTFLKHEDIMNGGEMIFEMGYKAKAWGMSNAPVSSITKNTLIPVPYFVSESQTFTDSLLIEIGSAVEGNIYYTFDGSEPTQQDMQYKSAIVITKDASIQATVFVDGLKSQSVSSEFFKIDGKRSIDIKSNYANQYAAAGDKTLIDYLRGSNSYRTGRWQGYREDLNVTVDLGDSQEINSMSIGFLQDIKSWIFYPTEVSYWTSQNNVDFNKAGVVANVFPDSAYGSFHQDYTISVNNTSARYIRIKAKNYGLCPDWHLGAGGTTWLFADEIIVD